jgi:hypothetical protein
MVVDVKIDTRQMRYTGEALVCLALGPIGRTVSSTQTVILTP